MERLVDIKETEFQVVDVYNTETEKYEEMEIALVTKEDFEWLVKTIETQNKALESYSRVCEDMTEDYEKAKVRIQFLEGLRSAKA